MVIDSSCLITQPGKMESYDESLHLESQNIIIYGVESKLRNEMCKEGKNMSSHLLLRPNLNLSQFICIGSNIRV